MVGEFQPQQQAAAAHVADAGVALLEGEQPVLQAPAGSGGPVGEALAAHHLQHRHADSRRQRVVDMGGVEQEVALLGLVGDRLGGHHRRQRQAGAQGLRERQDVRHHAVALEGEHPAGTANAGLRLVEDQQHAAGLAVRLQRREIARRQVEHAAGAEDRLGDEGGEIACRLPVQQVEGVVQLLAPVDALEPRPVGVRRRDRVGARHQRADATAPGLVGRRGRAAGHAVPGLREADHLPLAGHQLGDPDRGLVGLAAGRQQHRLREIRHQGGQRFGEVDHGGRYHRGEQVVQPADMVAHGGDDLRVAVAEDRAHLAGGEVENPAAVGVVQEGALGAHRDEGHEVPAVAHQVAVGAAPEAVVASQWGGSLRGGSDCGVVHGGLLALDLDHQAAADHSFASAKNSLDR